MTSETEHQSMRAMVLDQPGRLRESERPRPEPGPGQILVRVAACGVCRTDLHLLDGELADPKPGVVPGHQIVGRVEARGVGATALAEGRRVGVPWLGWTCGSCDFCGRGEENLCPEARFTGYRIDGGFAEYAVAEQQYAFPLPDGFSDVEAAPLLCAGLIGYRSLRMAGDARRVGLYGFGAAAHIVIQVARHEGREIVAFTRPGDREGQAFARTLGAAWAGGSDQPPPDPLDAAIVFAPVGSLVPLALRAVRPGGVVVCGGIHMSDIPSFPYELLWGERVLRSVANLTRKDALQFLPLAAEIPVRTEVEVFPLEQAPGALQALREGRVRGAAVLAVERR